MSLTAALGSRFCLQAAGGCLQHARGLLSLLAADASNAAGNSSSAAGRSISTTSSSHMGRVVVQDNPEKSAAPSNLYTKDNYQALSKQGWSLDACETVLQKHQQQQTQQRQQRHKQQQHRQGTYGGRQQKQHVDVIGHAMNATIQSCTSMDELRRVVESQAYKMTPVNMAVVIQKVPKVLLKPDGQADYTSAALLVDHMAHMMLPTLAQLGGTNIVLCLAAFVKCRYTPPGDVLTAMLADLTADDNRKISQMNLQSLGALFMSISKTSCPSSLQWPVLQAVLDHTTTRLQELTGTRQADPTRKAHHTEAARNANSIAMLAWLLGKQKLQSHDYIAALHKWIADRSNLRELSPMGCTQLWQGLRCQFRAHMSLMNANSQGEDSAAAAAAAAAGSSDPAAAGGESKAESASDQAETLDLDDSAAAAAADSADPEQILLTQQAMLRDYFGSQTLDSLAAITAQRITVMTEKELGHILASMGSLRYQNPELLAAAVAGLERIYKTTTSSSSSRSSSSSSSEARSLGGLSLLTRLSAGWLAAVLRQPKPALLLPLWVAAVEQPHQFEGSSVGRLLRVTGMLYDISGDVIQQQRQLLREEIHNREDRRGPVPGSSSSSSPEWVAAVADSLSQRCYECKPREIAHVLDAYSQIPGIPLHDQLFAAAAKHIQMHAHMFKHLKDIEMVAVAFERMNFKEGLPALKALQAQTEHLASGRA